MKNLFKSKVATIAVLVVTVILAGVAIFTAMKLYQLRQQSVAPNVPSSIPHAQEVPSTPTACQAITLNLTTGTPTPTPTGSTPTPTPTGSTNTPTPTPTGVTNTPTPTPVPSGTPNSCNGTCGSNTNCQSGYYCYQGFCRNPDCPTASNCSCGGAATATPRPTTTATPEASLPVAGVAWPTIAGVGLGSAVLILALLLAL